MNVWQSLTGQVKVKVTSANLGGSLTAMEKADIPIANAEFDGALSMEFTIRRTDFLKLQKLCEKRGETMETERRVGLYFTILGLLRRPVLVMGMLLLFLLSLWVPGRVFFVFVEGNRSVPTNLILEQAQLCGLEFGASRREIRSEKMKNALLQRLPQLQWAGVNTYGCVAVISVTEGQQTQIQAEPEGICSMIASVDGVIRQMTVTGGSAVCAVGQAVKAGQVLISGYTDCGICIRADKAGGEVFAETRRNLTAVFPLKYGCRGEIRSEYQNFSLIIGKKRINFHNSSGISGAECVRIYSENYVTLPGGFQLPIAIATERCIEYQMEERTFDDPEAVLQPFMESYLLSRMIAGQILSGVRSKRTTEDLVRVDGIFCCYEMIGLLRPEECLPEYENSGTNRQRRTGGRPDGRIWFL